MRVASDASLSLKFMHYEKHDIREEVFLKICVIVEIDIIIFAWKGMSYFTLYKFLARPFFKFC